MMFLIKSIKTGLIDCLDHAGNGIRSAGIHVHPNNALNAQMKNLDAAAADFKFLPIGGQGSVYDTKIKRNKEVKDINIPDMVTIPGRIYEELRWTDWRMLRDVKRRHLFVQWYPTWLCYNVTRKCQIIPQIIREDAHLLITRHSHGGIIPKGASFRGQTNRCVLTSRARGKVKQWRLSRMMFRHFADYNHLSGAQRSMWGP